MTSKAIVQVCFVREIGNSSSKGVEEAPGGGIEVHQSGLDADIPLGGWFVAHASVGVGQQSMDLKRNDTIQPGVGSKRPAEVPRLKTAHLFREELSFGGGHGAGQEAKEANQKVWQRNEEEIQIEVVPSNSGRSAKGNEKYQDASSNNGVDDR